MAELLRRDGFDIVAYDPFMGGGTEVPRGSADAVLCFEVLEHTPTPVETCRDILSFLKPDGSVLFSTLLQPADIEARGYDWWYVRPRNGHVSIHTLPSLSMLWSRVGCRLASDQTSVHIAFRDDQSLLHAWTGASTAA
jgi:2-polyprenyl-6-hydroxyphenyl methylase/3-demethylubiquinone-9 3-methyltransferase